MSLHINTNVLFSMNRSQRRPSLVAHVSHVTSVCFFHLHQLRLIRCSLTTDALHALVRALIHSRLDYCNKLLAGLPDNQLTRLQSVLRAADDDGDDDLIINYNANTVK